MSGTSQDDRLLDLARRLLDGEAIDWAAEGIEESEVREGMQRLQQVIGRAHEDATATAERIEGPENAVRLLRNEITRVEGGRGTESPDLLVVLEGLRSVLSRAGRSADAAEVAARADRIRAAYQLLATTGTLF